MDQREIARTRSDVRRRSTEAAPAVERAIGGGASLGWLGVGSKLAGTAGQVVPGVDGVSFRSDALVPQLLLVEELLTALFPLLLSLLCSLLFRLLDPPLCPRPLPPSKRALQLLQVRVSLFLPPFRAFMLTFASLAAPLLLPPSFSRSCH